MDFSTFRWRPSVLPPTAVAMAARIMTRCEGGPGENIRIRPTTRGLSNERFLHTTAVKSLN